MWLLWTQFLWIYKRPRACDTNFFFNKTNNCFTALWSRIPVSRCSHKGETYWNSHWIFMSRMSFLLLTYSVKALQGNPVVWSSFVSQTWYQHPMSNQQCQSKNRNYKRLVCIEFECCAEDRNGKITWCLSWICDHNWYTFGLNWYIAFLT